MPKFLSLRSIEDFSKAASKKNNLQITAYFDIISSVVSWVTKEIPVEPLKLRKINPEVNFGL